MAEQLECSQEFKYDAFISYKHDPYDTLIATGLHSALETYRTPSKLVRQGYPSKLSKIFRDKDELPTSSDLSHDIEEALRASHYLIVVASPESARSEWVQKEIEYFTALHGEDHVLTLLIKGEPNDAFPHMLIHSEYNTNGKRIELKEPLAADIRSQDVRGAKRLLKVEKLRLIAVILGCTFDDLKQREHERRRRRAFSVVLSAFILMASFSGFILWQLHITSLAKNEALRNESTLYASLSRVAVNDGDVLLGLTLALEALPTDIENPEKPLVSDAIDSLNAAVSNVYDWNITYLYPDMTGKEMNRIRWFFTHEDKWAIFFDDKSFVYYDAQNGSVLDTWELADEYVILDVKDSLVLAAKYNPYPTVRLCIWNIETKQTTGEFDMDLAELGADEQSLYKTSNDFNGALRAGFSPKADRIFFSYLYAYSRNENRCLPSVHIYDAATGASVYKFDFQLQEALYRTSHSYRVVFNSERYLSVFTEDEYCLLDISTDDIAVNTFIRDDSSIYPYDPYIRAAVYNDQTVAYLTDVGSLKIEDLDKGEETTLLDFVKYDSLSVSGSGRYIFTDGNLYDLSSRTKIAAFEDQTYDSWLFIGDYLINTTKHIGYQISEDGSLKTILFNMNIFEDSNALIAFSSDYRKVIYGTDRFLLARLTQNERYTTTWIQEPSTFIKTMGRYILIGNYDYYKQNYKNVDMNGFYAVFDTETEQIKPISIPGWDYSDITRTYLYHDDLYFEYDGILHVIDHTDFSLREVTVAGYGSGSLSYLWMEEDNPNAILQYDKEIVVFNLEERQVKAQFEVSCGYLGYSDMLKKAGYFKDTNFLWVAYYSDMGCGIKIFDIQQEKEIYSLSVSKSEFFSCGGCISSDGTRFYIDCDDYTSLYEINDDYSLREIRTLRGHMQAKDADHIVISDGEDFYDSINFNIVDSHSGDLIATLDSTDSARRMRIIDGNLFVQGYRSLSLFSLEDGRRICNLFQPRSYLDSNLMYNDFAVTQDGQEIVLFTKYNDESTMIFTFPLIQPLNSLITLAHNQLGDRTFDLQELNNIRFN
jgi:hypothetical protein